MHSSQLWSHCSSVLYQVPRSTVNKPRNEQVTSVQRPLSLSPGGQSHGRPSSSGDDPLWITAHSFPLQCWATGLLLPWFLPPNLTIIQSCYPALSVPNSPWTMQQLPVIKVVARVLPSTDSLFHLHWIIFLGVKCGALQSTEMEPIAKFFTYAHTKKHYIIGSVATNLDLFKPSKLHDLKREMTSLITQ